jgi:hypothetical protein
MSYLEDAVYSFIKDIFTRGIIVLTNKRFLLYTSIAIILPILLTIFSFISGSEAGILYVIFFKLELAVCVALIITGIISFKTRLVKAEHSFFLAFVAVLFGLSFTPTPVVTIVENIFVFVSFYSWIITINIATLMAIREFMVSWPGWVIKLGDKEDRIAFSPIVRIGVFASLAWFTYSVFTNFTWSWLLAFIAGSIIIYTIYVFTKVSKDANLATILSFFYFALLYHLFVRAETSTGFLIFDIVVIVGSTIFTAQSISRLIASKKYSIPYHWDSLIILLMGFMLGYHLLGIKIALFSGLEFLYSLFHDISFGFGTLIIFGVLLLYISNPKFKRFSKPKVTLKSVVKRFSGAGLEAVKDYAGDLRNTLKKKNWKFELKKKKDEDD